MSHDPQTPAEWQEAVDLVAGMKTLVAAKDYGLVEGLPTVDLDRCEDILSRGAELGYRPSPTAGRDMVAAMLEELGIHDEKTHARFAAIVGADPQ